jgi:hypothetical protein
MRYFIIFSFFFSSLNVVAQEDLMDLLNEETASEEKKKIDYTTATFKSTRIINSHSTEIPGKGVMQFIIHHRFGRINSGWRDFFGLDDANIRLGFEYGINNWVAVGFGRSKNEKLYDFFAKAKVLRQSTGSVKMPLSVDVVSTLGINTEKAKLGRENEMNIVRRMSFAHQLLIARKFHEYFSFQLMPTWVHRNLVPRRTDDNDVFAVGAGTAIKLTRSVRLTGEYHYVLSKETANQFYNPVSVGIDIETGGHVFQLMLSNSRDMVDNLGIPKTSGSWKDGGIHFGFNVNRVFTIVDYQKRQQKKLLKSQQKG